MSAKNSFSVVACRVQLRGFLAQWGGGKAFCHRCGSGPFAVTTIAADAADDAPPAACGACSTILVVPDPSGSDLRAVADFEAQILRRRIAVMEAKTQALQQLNLVAAGPLSGLTFEAVDGSEAVSDTPPRLSPTRPTTVGPSRSRSSEMGLGGRVPAGGAAAGRTRLGEGPGGAGLVRLASSAPRTASVPAPPRLAPFRLPSLPDERAKQSQSGFGLDGTRSTLHDPTAAKQRVSK